MTLAACTFKISSRPFKSGSSTGTRLSNLPGLNKAGSRDSGLLVAARITTPVLPSKPSISVNNWLRVCSRSSLPPDIFPALRLPPMASISSMNTIHGAFSFACLNKSRTLLAPIPTNISTNSEPEIEKNGTLDSPATAFASIVLPVPGGPTSKMPLGMVAPICLYLPGSCRYVTISCKDSLASSSPATSLKRIPCWLFTYTLALDLPMEKLIAPPPPLPPVIRFNMKFQNNAANRIGPTHVSRKFAIGEVSS